MKIMDDSSPTTVSILLFRNLIATLFIHADKSFLNLSENSKILQFLRRLFISLVYFLIRIVTSFNFTSAANLHVFQKPRKSNDNRAPSCEAVGDTGIARALSQSLSLVTDIPVSSRKYEAVRSLAEKLIDDNVTEGFDALREVNRTVLSAALERTLGRLEAAVLDKERGVDHGSGLMDYGFRTVRSIGDLARTLVVKPDLDASRLTCSAEKLAAEVLWLAQKLAACGFVDEAVCRWASASNLAWLSLSAEPPLQCSLVKVAAFMFKNSKEVGKDRKEENDGNNILTKYEQQKQTNMKMLLSWLPLLCRANNGTDTPILSNKERLEIEQVLEEMIDMLEKDEEKEKVLSLWLHHFTFSPYSDWPNLHGCYTRWCTASRKILIFR